MKNIINKLGIVGILLGISLQIGGLIYYDKHIGDAEKYDKEYNTTLVGSLIALGSIPIALYCGNKGRGIKSE